MSTDTVRAEKRALTCPYCGSGIEATEVYVDTGSIVISCENRECGAEWHSDGSPWASSRWTGGQS